MYLLFLPNMPTHIPFKHDTYNIFLDYTAEERECFTTPPQYLPRQQFFV